jgi:hypothetical protein
VSGDRCNQIFMLMKTLLLTVLIAIGVAGAGAACGMHKGEDSCRAAKEKQVQAYVEAALALTYGKPVVGQGQTGFLRGDFRQAAYSHRGMRRSLFFTADNARMLARIQVVDAHELSAKLARKLARKYKGYRIGQVIRYSDGQTLYFVTLTKDREEVLVSYAR